MIKQFDESKGELLVLKQLNLTLMLDRAACEGFFVYPNQRKRKASTAEILNFLAVYNAERFK